MKSDALTATVLMSLPQRQAIAGWFSRFAERLKLDENRNQAIPFTEAELVKIRDRAKVAIEESADASQRDSLKRLVASLEKSIVKAQGIFAIPEDERMYQLTIRLLDTHPPVWRRFLVPDYTLEALHHTIQFVMGWEAAHPYCFQINEQQYVDYRMVDEGDIGAESVCLSEVIPPSGKKFKFLYTYDFGDRWEHLLTFEKCVRVTDGDLLPRCLEGERACPPEDIGGPWSYYRILEMDEEGRRKAFWLWPKNFDPEKFDPEEVNREIRASMEEVLDELDQLDNEQFDDEEVDEELEDDEIEDDEEDNL